ALRACAAAPALRLDRGAGPARRAGAEIGAGAISFRYRDYRPQPRHALHPAKPAERARRVRPGWPDLVPMAGVGQRGAQGRFATASTYTRAPSARAVTPMQTRLGRAPGGKASA